jgi:hypothetical protein
VNLSVLLFYGVQVVAVVSASTFQGTLCAAFSQTAVQGAPAGVGVAQMHPSREPFAQAVVQLAVCGQGVLQGVGLTVPQLKAQNASKSVIVFIAQFLPAQQSRSKCRSRRSSDQRTKRNPSKSSQDRLSDLPIFCPKNS